MLTSATEASIPKLLAEAARFLTAVLCSLLRNSARDQRCTRRLALDDAGFAGAVEWQQPYCQI